MTTSPLILSAFFLGICLFAAGNTVAAASASPPSEPTAAASTFKTPLNFAPSSTTTTVVESMTPSQCATPIPCQPTLCPSGQCYVLTTRTLVTLIPISTPSVSTALSPTSTPTLSSESTSTTTSSTPSPPVPLATPCPTQIICGCGPDPTIATPTTNPTPKPVEPCSEREVAEAGCAQGQVAVPTSVGANCRQCVCVESDKRY